MGALQTDTALRATDAGVAATLSRDWEVWGPNGGYVSAIALRGAGGVAPEGHRPATFSAQYIGAAQFGDVTVEATPIKTGRSAWLINVRLIQDGRAFLQAQVWTTNKSEGPTNLDVEMPDAPRPDSLKTYQEHLPPGTEMGPFWGNIDAKPLEWRDINQPRIGGAEVTEWFRFKDFDAGGDPFVDFGRSVVLIDRLVWPAHHRGLVPRPDYIAPSLDLTVWFHAPAPHAQWLLVDARADVAGGGLIHGRTRIWSEDGRLVATGGSNMLHTPRR